MENHKFTEEKALKLADAYLANGPLGINNESSLKPAMVNFCSRNSSEYYTQVERWNAATSKFIDKFVKDVYRDAVGKFLTDPVSNDISKLSTILDFSVA